MQISDRLKKILMIVGFVLLVILLCVGYYFLFFAPEPEPDDTLVNVNGEMIPFSQLPDVLNRNVVIEENVNVEVSLPDIDTTANGDKTLVQQVGESDVSDITLTDTGGEILYYDPSDGKFYQIDEYGNLIALSDVVYENVDEVTWGNDKDKAILEFPDESNVYYNFEEDQQYTLPKEMEDFSFSPTDGEIGYKYMAMDEEDRWLGVAAPDGSGIRGLEQLGDNDANVDVDWSPSGQAVATFFDFIDGGRQQVGVVGTKGENFKSMTVHGMDFRSDWSPDGQRMLYSTFTEANDYKPTLWVVDAYGDDIGKNRQELGVSTWVDKCTFSGSSTAYCAVPTELPRGAGFADGVADETSDHIYKVDLTTGQSSLIAIPSNEYGENTFTIEQMLVTEDGDTLYFKDTNSQKLNKIDL